MPKTNRKVKDPDVVLITVYDDQDRRIDSRGHNVALKTSISLDKELYKALKLVTENVDEWIQEQYLSVKRNKLAKRSGYSRAIQRLAIKLLVSHIK